MKVTSSNRRIFIKNMAKLSAVAAATAMFPGLIFAEEQLKSLPIDEDVSWNKAPCRFCGVGCGLLIGTRRHDAALLVYNDKAKQSRLDIGLAFNADDDVSEPQFIQSPNASFYSRNNYKHMQYAWFHKTLSKVELSFLAMNLGYQFDENEVSLRQTIGSHGKTKKNRLTFGWDLYYQLGENEGRNVNAYLAGLNVTYHVNQTPIQFGVEFISGKDDDDTSSDVKHFIPDFGTNHAHNGYMDYFFVGPSNGTVGVTDLYLKIKFKLKKRYLSIHSHHFLTGSTQLDQNNNILSKSMGSEVDLVYSIPFRKDINFTIGYSFLMASETMRVLRNRDKAFNSWGWMMLTVKPELFRSK